MQRGDDAVETRHNVRTTSESAAGPSRPYAYYALLIAVYNALFGGFLVVYRRWRHPVQSIKPFDFILLGLGTLRLARMISEDEIAVVLRRPLIEEAHGERIARGHGLRRALGKLVLCPTCVGTWIAAFLTYALHLFPRYTRVFLAIMSASAVEQSVDALLSLVYADRDLLRDEEKVVTANTTETRP